MNHAISNHDSPPALSSTGQPPPEPSASSDRLVRWELQDLLFLGFIGAILLLLLVFGVILARHPHPWLMIVYFMTVAAVAVGARYLPRVWDHPVSWFLRWWYPPILFLFCFEAIGWMIHLIRPDFLDPHLIAADRALFGGDITVWLQQRAQPWLTEIMYFCYTSLYFFIPGVGIPLYLRSRGDRTSPTGSPLREYLATVTASMLFCYIHFLFTPAAGPVFWADYPGPVLTLPGGPITLFEQWVFDKGAIVGGAFPSSHVVVAMVAALYAVRFRVAPRFFTPVVIGLGLSTLYTGYHYGVDVLYAMVLATVMMIAVPRLFRWYEERRKPPPD